MRSIEGIMVAAVGVGFAYFVASEIGTAAAGNWMDVTEALRAALRR